jgi:hypothetical protein
MLSGLLQGFHLGCGKAFGLLPLFVEGFPGGLQLGVIGRYGAALRNEQLLILQRRFEGRLIRKALFRELRLPVFIL